MKDNKNSFFFIFLTAFLFATMEPVSKTLHMNFAVITAIRFLVGAAILLPFTRQALRRKQITLSLPDLLLLSGLGVLVVCVSMPLLQLSVLTGRSAGMSAAIVGIIFSTNSVFTILLAVPVLGEKITARKLAAVALCLTGIVVCSYTKNSGASLPAVLYAIGAALSFSVYTVLSKKYAVRFTGIIQTGVSFASGSLLLFVGIGAVSLLSGVNLFAGTFASPGVVWTLVYLGVALTGIGYFSFFRAIEKSSAMAASLVFFIKPVLTPFVTAFVEVFIEKTAPGALSPRVFIALALVVGGSLLATLKPKPAAPVPEDR